MVFSVDLLILPSLSLTFTCLCMNFTGIGLRCRVCPSALDMILFYEKNYGSTTAMI